jgi:Ca2+-binding RTX toxin-like protein
MSLSQDALSISTENHLARWNATLPTGTPIVITYSFMTTLTAYDVRTTTAVTPYSERQKQGVRDAFDTWEEVSGLTFLEIDRGGDMRISMIGEDDMASIGGRPAGGFAYLPFVTGIGETSEDGNELGAIFHASVGGDVFLNADSYANDSNSFDYGRSGFETMLHEIGHALGLEHTFDGDFQIRPSRDNTDVSIMSYTDGSNPSELGTADVELIQFLYGTQSYEMVYNEEIEMLKIFGTSASEFIHGSTESDFFTTSSGNDTVFGSDGDDFALFTQNLTFDGGNGRDTAISIMGSNLLVDSGGLYQFDAPENTDLSVDDFFMGGFGDDELSGGLGNDILLGDRPSQFLSGSDFLQGGKGVDFLQGGGGADVFYFESFDSLTREHEDLGPDVIGYVDENTLYSELDSNNPMISNLLADASKDFEIGVDIVQLAGLSSGTISNIENFFSGYLTNTSDGVVFDTYSISILFVDLSASDLLAGSVSDIFEFV